MKIATWNLERPTKNGHKTAAIIECLKKINADIFILTETNDYIDLGAAYIVAHTAPFKENKPAPGERRVSIFSKYPCADRVDGFETFNPETAICLNLKTPLGELAVYGTIIGVSGNKGKQFQHDLKEQLLDFEKIHSKANACCISGDFNISFSDNYYFTIEGRDQLNTSFDQLGLQNYTAGLKDNIDHIVLSNKFVGNRKTICTHWNDTKDKAPRLSDHKGVLLEIFE